MFPEREQSNFGEHTLITSAPASPKPCVQKGPAKIRLKSNTRTPVRGGGRMGSGPEEKSRLQTHALVASGGCNLVS